MLRQQESPLSHAYLLDPRGGVKTRAKFLCQLPAVEADRDREILITQHDRCRQHARYRNLSVLLARRHEIPNSDHDKYRNAAPEPVHR